MASRIHRVWATCCRQTLLCLQKKKKITGVRGKQAASDGTLPRLSPSLPLFSERPGGTDEKIEEEEEEEEEGKKSRGELKRNWKRGEGEGRMGRGGREKLDEWMNYAKLSEAAIVGGAGRVRGSWSSPATINHSHTTPPCGGSEREREREREIFFWFLKNTLFTFFPLQHFFKNKVF